MTTLLVGYVSTACICLTLIPQSLAIIARREVRGISLPTYMLGTAGNITGLWYGIGIGSAPVIITSAVGAILSILIIALVAHYRTRHHVNTTPR